MAWTEYFRGGSNRDRPMLWRDGTRWHVDFIPVWHVSFVSQRVDNRGVRPALKPEIEAWFEQHDPHYVSVKVGNNLRVQFTSEDAAMHFRLRFGARIAEDAS